MCLFKRQVQIQAVLCTCACTRIPYQPYFPRLTRYVFLRDGSQSAIAEFPPPASPRLPEALFSMDESAPTVPLNLILASSPTTTVFWQKINVRQLTTNKMLGNSNAIRNSLYVFSRLKRETTIPVLLSA